MPSNGCKVDIGVSSGTTVELSAFNGWFVDFGGATPLTVVPSVVSKVDAKVELSTFGIVPAIGDRLDLGWFVDFGGTAPLTVVP